MKTKQNTRVEDIFLIHDSNKKHNTICNVGMDKFHSGWPDLDSAKHSKYNY